MQDTTVIEDELIRLWNKYCMFCDIDYKLIDRWAKKAPIEQKKYYKNGLLKEEGIFQTAGLLFGRSYYPSGLIKFEGKFNDKTHGDGSYYGPSFPVYGRFYSETGKLLYEGEFKVKHQGNLGYPKVVFPKGFPSL